MGRRAITSNNAVDDGGGRVRRGKVDADLLAAARVGDVSAFEPLYRTNVAWVYAMCLRRLGDRTRAEEATQGIVVRTWQRLASVRGDSSLATWSCRVARVSPARTAWGWLSWSNKSARGRACGGCPRRANGGIHASMHQ